MVGAAKLDPDYIDQNFNEFIFVIRYLSHVRYRMNGQFIPKIPKVNSISQELLTKALEYISDVKGREIKNLYKTVDFHARGSYGAVFTVKGKIWNVEEDKIDIDKFAIKKIPEKSQEAISRDNNEVACLLELRHPNIVQIKAAYRLPHEMRIVMEYIEGGTLAQIITIRKLTESHILYISQQLLSGLAFLHSRNFVHRDLNSSNVMLSVTGNLKIIDFGCCTELHGPTRLEPMGTAHYMAPEIIKRQPCSLKIDIWSFGIVFLELFVRHNPFKTKIEAMFKAVCGDTLREINPSDYNMSEESFSFCQQCLIADPEKRLSVGELQENPLIKYASLNNDLKTLLKTIALSIKLSDSGI